MGYENEAKETGVLLAKVETFHLVSTELLLCAGKHAGDSAAFHALLEAYRRVIDLGNRALTRPEAA